LTHIKDYLGIEAIRFGERLKIKYHVEEAVLEKPVLSLILLPIIENAIKHGISQCLTGGLLTISIFKDGDFISIKISNPYEKPARPTKGEGMGIRTLQQRLRFHYGSSATCIINKAKDTFSVTLLIPESMEKHNAS